MSVKYSGNNPIIHDCLKKISFDQSGDDLFLVEKIEDLKNIKSSQNAIYLGNNLSHKDLFETIQKNKVHHIVQKSADELTDKLTAILNLISKRKELIQKIENEIKMESSRKTLRIPILDGVDRFSIYEKIKEFLSVNSVQTSITDILLMISYELLSNVLYDAPYYYEQQFKVAPKKKMNDMIGEFIISIDSKKAFIAAVDDFGSLNIQKLIDGIVTSYQSDMLSVQDGPVGAGIGCRMMFDYMSDIFISVEQMKRTFIGGTLPIKMGLKKIQLIPKDFHFFEV